MNAFAGFLVAPLIMVAPDAGGIAHIDAMRAAASIIQGPVPLIVTLISIPVLKRLLSPN